MMKVAPRPRTSGIIAAWLMRTKLPKVRKFGLMKVMMTQSSTSTTTGAQEASRQRRFLTGVVAGSGRCLGCVQVRHHAVGKQRISLAPPFTCVARHG